MRAVIYCRKSTEDKSKQIQSIDDQVRECLKVAEAKNLTLVYEPFKESKTGKKADVRVEFYKMLNMIKQGKIDAVIVWDASRLARNAKDGGEIIYLVDNCGLEIICPYTTYDSTNSFMLFMEFGMSTDYSKKLSHNVKRGLETKLAKGWYPGPAPEGYLNRKSDIRGMRDIVVDQNKFSLCRRWWELMLSGKYSIDSSREIITTLGLTNNKNKPFSRSASYRFFRNPFYYGYFNYRGELYKGSHEPMVSKDEWNKVQTLINGGRFIKDSKDPMEFAGFIKCGECGATITGERHTKTYKNGNSQTFYHYRCTKKKGACSQKYLNAQNINDQINQYISTLTLEPGYLEWIRMVLKRRNSEEFDFVKKQKELQTKKIIDIFDRKERLFAMKADGLIGDQEYQTKKSELLKEENNVNDMFDDNRIPQWERIMDQTLDFSKRVYELFNQPNPTTRRMVIQILGSNLTIMNGKLDIKPKGAFMFLKQLKEVVDDKLIRLEPNNMPIYPNDSIVSSLKMVNCETFGTALEPIKSFRNYFYNPSDESRLLAYQLELLDSSLNDGLLSSSKILISQ